MNLISIFFGKYVSCWRCMWHPSAACPLHISPACCSLVPGGIVIASIGRTFTGGPSLQRTKSSIWSVCGEHSSYDHLKVMTVMSRGLVCSSPFLLLMLSGVLQGSYLPLGLQAASLSSCPAGCVCQHKPYQGIVTNCTGLGDNGTKGALEQIPKDTKFLWVPFFLIIRGQLKSISLLLMSWRRK